MNVNRNPNRFAQTANRPASSADPANQAPDPNKAPDPNQPLDPDNLPEGIVMIEIPLEDIFGGGFGPLPPRQKSPLEQKLDSLEQAGLKAPDQMESARIKGSIRAGYESLVPFENGSGKIVASFKSEAEVDTLEALVTGGQVDPGVKQTADQMNAMAARGEQFYLKRSGNYLLTTPEAAALVVARGDEVMRSNPKAEISTLSDSAGVAAAAAETFDPNDAKIKTVKILSDGERIGMTAVAFDPDEGTSMDISLKFILEQMRKVGKPYAETKGELAEALNAGGRVAVSFDEEHRPIAIPTPLNKAQIETAVQYETNPTPAMVEYREAFKELVKDDAVIMAREQEGGTKGMVARADSRRALLNLVDGGDVVALTKDGHLHRLTDIGDMKELQTKGKVDGPPPAQFDNSQPSDNLFMYYHVSPFDPIEKGNYEDAPLRLADVGSSKELDIVQMRSDLPSKRNLLVERVQKGGLEELERLAPETAMNDPQVLEDFVYKTVKDNINDKHIRMLVGGHGGAEKGLLPDGDENNAAANGAMEVDDFAKAIARGLDRVEQETGVRREIDNLVLCSCLMGNTSFIHALAQTGDIKFLTASPELMMGSNPSAIFEYLADPATSDASAEEYANKLVDIVSTAPSMPGGHPNMKHAQTYGAYDLSKVKADGFQSKLDGFFKACLKEPEYAEYIKEDISKCPTYGINKYLNAMFDVDGRDLCQVLDRINGDARIGSEAIKKAAGELKEATLAQVMRQDVDEKYEGRQGPSLYLPVDRFDFDTTIADTELLKSTSYNDFMEMIFDKPLQRGLIDNILVEINKSTEKMKASGHHANQTPGVDPMEEFEAPEDDKMGGFFGQMMKRREESQENQAIKALEEREESAVKATAKFVKKALRTTAAIAGGLAGFAVGAIPGVVIGALSGARAGFTGTSISGTGKPTTEEPTRARLVLQAMGATAEEPAINMHQKWTYKYGEGVGRLMATGAGLVTGALGGAVGGGGIVGLLGAGLGYGVMSIPTALIPTGDPKKNHPEELFGGMFGPFGPMGGFFLNQVLGSGQPEEAKQAAS